MPIRIKVASGALCSVVLLTTALGGVPALSKELGAAESAVRCSAYFFMAANANSMQEFDRYYSAGEYAYNGAVKLVGEETALSKFNDATGEINTLIDRDWLNFDEAENRYSVICADLLRDANNPDRVIPLP